eukprot:765098-Hanusia_phi.AAC.2
MSMTEVSIVLRDESGRVLNPENRADFGCGGGGDDNGSGCGGGGDDDGSGCGGGDDVDDGSGCGGGDDDDD